MHMHNKIWKYPPDKVTWMQTNHLVVNSYLEDNINRESKIAYAQWNNWKKVC